jgi:hypothetical protein
MRKKRQPLRKKLGEDKGKDQRQAGPPFIIRMGLPHMDALWNDLQHREASKQFSVVDQRLYKKLGKALYFLSQNPFYPSLNSHEISSLTQKYGKKVFESYLENRTPGAARLFWTYGPGRAEITILALEPHPEPGEYGRVKLDTEPADE